MIRHNVKVKCKILFFVTLVELLKRQKKCLPKLKKCKVYVFEDIKHKLERKMGSVNING